MGTLTHRAFAPETLEQAWANVRANDLADAVLSPSVKSFAKSADENLERLTTKLADRTYRPAMTRRVIITTGAKRRELDIPRVTDRIVARAILATITPTVDPLLGPFSYAYRPGLGVADAVQAVVELREEGLSWVLRTDIDDCFPAIPREAVRERLFPLLHGEMWLVQVIRLMLKRRSQLGRRRMLTKGLPQGCSLSPLFANLVLADLDSHLATLGFPVVRYADDLVIAGQSPEECLAARDAASAFLEGLAMKLGDDKTEIMSFEEGFAFLGEEFGSRLPSPDPEFRTDEPEKKVVYAGVDGARIRLAAGRFIIDSRDGTALMDVASSQVGRIVCFGSTALSAGARSWALNNDIEIVLASRRGSYLGSLVNGRWAPRRDRLQAQLALTESPDGLRLATSIVKAKVAKQLALLRRFSRVDCADSANTGITSLQGILAGLDTEPASLQALMGSEGAAARAYFAALGQMVPADLRFAVRSRQPPRDTFNAALSYLYAILLGECVTATHAAGLEPGLGILHSDQPNRPSLALDLMEEFRPLVVDQVVMRLARQGALSAQHGMAIGENEGIYLNSTGKAGVIQAYELRMLQRTRGALPDFAGTIRRHLFRQAQRLRASIMDPTQPWTGLTWR